MIPSKNGKRKGSTVLLALGAGLLVAGALYVVTKLYKKEYKKIEEEKKQADEQLEELGVSPEALENNIIPGEDDENLVKKLYSAVEYNTQWNSDLFNIDGCLGNVENIIHLRQSDKNRFLDFLIQVPTFKSGNYRSPRIGDYMKACKAASQYMWGGIVRVCPPPRECLEGYFIVAYGIEGRKDEEFYRTIKIPRRLYTHLANEKFDGLTEYINQIRESGEVRGKLRPDEVFDLIPGNTDVYINIRPVDVILVYRISFLIRQREGGIGIDLSGGLKCLKYLTEKFKVRRENYNQNNMTIEDSENDVTYDHLIFHVPDENNHWDFLTYYCAAFDEKGERIVVKNDYEYQAKRKNLRED